MALFISTNWDDYCNQNWLISDVNAVTQIAIDFHAFIVNAHKDATPPVDEHLKMIAGFILMTNDFKDFVDSYRCSDSVGCERGYYNLSMKSTTFSCSRLLVGLDAIGRIRLTWERTRLHTTTVYMD